MYLGSNYLGKTYRNLLFALKLALSQNIDFGSSIGSKLKSTGNSHLSILKKICS